MSSHSSLYLPPYLYSADPSLVVELLNRHRQLMADSDKTNVTRLNCGLRHMVNSSQQKQPLRGRFKRWSGSTRLHGFRNRKADSFVIEG